VPLSVAAVQLIEAWRRRTMSVESEALVFATLLKRAYGRIDAFVTMDRKLEREHDLSVLPFGVVIVHARSP